MARGTLDSILARSFPRVNRWLGALASACVLVVAVPASAAPGGDDPARAAARELANEAANAFARNDFARAHELCTQAYRVVPAPTIALLDARSLVALRRFLEAERAYQRAASARLGPGSPDAFTRAVNEASAERAALLPRIPRLKVVLAGRGVSRRVSVRLDERPLGAVELGAWMLADPREHQVRLELDGRPALAESIPLGEGDARIVTLELEPQRHDPLRTWGYVGLGGAAVGAALGLLTGGIALGAHDQAERECANRQCPAGSAGAEAVDRFRTYRTLSTASYGFAVASAGFGAVALLWPREGTTARLSISSSFAGVALEGNL